MASGHHTFDMYGHEPGCGLCADLRAEQELGDRVARSYQQTLSKESASTVTIALTVDTPGAPPVSLVRSFTVPAGGRLDPGAIAIAASGLSYEAIKARRR